NQLGDASQPPSPQSGQEDLDRLTSNLDKLVDNALQQALQNRDTTPSADNGSQAGAQSPDNNSPLLSAAQLEAQRRALVDRLPGSNGASQPDSLQPDAPANAGVVADALTQQLAANMARQASQGTGSPVPPMDRTAGVDPAAERLREQQKQQAEQRRQQQVQQKEDKKQEVTNSNQQLIERIQ